MRWGKTLKWILWGAAGVALIAFAFVVKSLFEKGGPQKKDKLIPDPPKFVKDKMDEAYEEHLVAHATTKATEKEQKEQLGTIMGEEDGPKRRKDLAAFLRAL